MKILFTCLWAFLLVAFPGKAQTPDKEEHVLVTAEQLPTFRGGSDSLMRFLASNIRYPQLALQNGEEGVVYITFVVDTLGRIINPTVVKSASPSLDAEGLRVVTSMAAWEPGRHQGRPVAVRFTLPIRFAVNGKTRKIRPVRNAPAKFPGNEDALNAYFAENLKYPPNALKNNIAGTVVVSFNILKDGKAIGFKIENNVNKELGAEALRVLRAMPRWEPALSKGRPYTTKMVVDIPFVLP